MHTSVSGSSEANQTEANDLELIATPDYAIYDFVIEVASSSVEVSEIAERLLSGAVPGGTLR